MGVSERENKLFTLGNLSCGQHTIKITKCWMEIQKSNNMGDLSNCKS